LSEEELLDLIRGWGRIRAQVECGRCLSSEPRSRPRSPARTRP